MAKINQHYKALQSGYLFSEIARRTRDFEQSASGVEVLRLGIGNTTEALSPAVISGLAQSVVNLADTKTYSGYGDEQGDKRLRQELVQWYARQGVALAAEEIFISDGAKSDSANISTLFEGSTIVAVQDPVYPVYVDSNVIHGRGGKFHNGRYENIVYMPCHPDNDFSPELPDRHVDLIYICSPNNPTGTVATKAQLQRFVDYAREYKAVIIFDAAYSAYIKDPTLPKSIYEIPGAKECAIEINSFSKWAGFTGVRLGWTVVPRTLVAEATTEGELNAAWNRRQCTMFNGASNIAQAGGIAVLSQEGQRESHTIVTYYMENARLIREGLQRKGLTIYGGENAPYIWLQVPKGMTSWEFFDVLLRQTHVVGTPGSGFGVCGEGYFRLSAFGHRNNIKKAVQSIERNLEL
jgi:LL-diaminopimelate aminotransferase